MTRVLFVHGTGVRKARHTALLKEIRSRFTEQRSELLVSSCFWGEKHGASLSAGGHSIPRRTSRRAAPGVGNAEEELVALWAALWADPLCQLRWLAETRDRSRQLSDGPKEGPLPPMARLAGRALVAALDELPEKLAAEPGELGPLLSQVGLEEFFGAAVADVLPSDELHGACARSLPDRSELLTAVASAVLARMLQRGDGQVPLSGDERDRIVELLAARLESGYRGIFSRSAGFLGRQAMKVTTQPLAQFLRGPATERAVPPLGDILHYQAHGEGLRNYLAEHIRQSDEDVVVLAHSLGGVAAVDLLASRPMPQVRLLVTVGSQAGFLHELGALAGLKPGVRELPSYMPDWLNIFDRRDFLAYLAAPVFNGGPTGLSRVRDFEVYSRQPFPLSHSAYWKLDGVYAEICALIA